MCILQLKFEYKELVGYKRGFLTTHGAKDDAIKIYELSCS